MMIILSFLLISLTNLPDNLTKSLDKWTITCVSKPLCYEIAHLQCVLLASYQEENTVPLHDKNQEFIHV